MRKLTLVTVSVMALGLCGAGVADAAGVINPAHAPGSKTLEQSQTSQSWQNARNIGYGMPESSRTSQSSQNAENLSASQVLQGHGGPV